MTADAGFVRELDQDTHADLRVDLADVYLHSKSYRDVGVHVARHPGTGTPTLRDNMCSTTGSMLGQCQRRCSNIEPQQAQYWANVRDVVPTLS